MSYVIFQYVSGVKMYLGYEDWELCKKDAILFNSFQASAITSSFDDCYYEGESV